MLFNLTRALRNNQLIIFVVLLLVTSPIQASLLVEKKVRPVTYFVNRSNEIGLILQNLEKYNVVSLVGVTSIGKTELARKYASFYQNKYNLIWFFDSSTDISEQFVLLAKKINHIFLLKDKDKLSENAIDSKKEVMEFLATKDNWLLVFDNLRVNENNRLIDIINWQHNGHVIICSQDSKNLPNVVYLYRLNKEHGLSLLKNILTSNVEEQFLEKLIDIFKGYPGPIAQGAMLLKEHNYLSLEEYKTILLGSSDPIVAHMQLIRTIISEGDNDLLLKIALINNQNFSKGILKFIVHNSDSIGQSLYNLNRFGLIKKIETMDNNSIFEMHDAVKDAVLRINKASVTKEVIANIISKFNSLMPKGVSSKYSFMSSDPTLMSNLEVILNNAEIYKVDINTILAFRRNLTTYYMATLDHYNWEKMKNWLEQKEASKVINPSGMNEVQKINYAWFMVDIGMYEDFVKSNYISALSRFNQSKEILKNIKGQPELKSTILFQAAQTYAYGGDIANAERSMIEADNIIQQYKNADYDMGLYWFIMAKIQLAKANYSAALLAIEKNIQAESHLPQDTFTAPTYILQSEILNFAGRYDESLRIIERMYSQEIGNNKPDHEIHARILTQLAKAQLGKGMVDLALNNAINACNIFNKEIEKYKTQSIINTDLAAALVVKGDALTKQEKLEEAIENYNIAESIYLRRYGSNYKIMDDISYLLAQGTKAAYFNKDQFWINHFQDQLFQNFGKEHFRSKEVIDFAKVHYNLSIE